MVRIFLYSESSLLYNVHVQSGRTNADLCIDGKYGFLTAFLVYVCTGLYTVSFTNDRGAKKPSFVRVHLKRTRPTA